MRPASTSRLAGSAPRTPRRISAAAIPSIIDSAVSVVAGASRNVTSLSTSTSTPPSPNATTLPKVSSVTVPTITSWPELSSCCTWTPTIRASAWYALALSMMVWNPSATSAGVFSPTSTPPASVLCRMSGETIFSTTGRPISSARVTASSALVASPSCGVAMPYASTTSRPSGAVSESRPSARTWSRTRRTASRS